MDYDSNSISSRFNFFQSRSWVINLFRSRSQLQFNRLSNTDYFIQNTVSVSDEDPQFTVINKIFTYFSTRIAISPGRGSMWRGTNFITFLLFSTQLLPVFVIFEIFLEIRTPRFFWTHFVQITPWAAMPLLKGTVSRECKLISYSFNRYFRETVPIKYQFVRYNFFWKLY